MGSPAPSGGAAATRQAAVRGPFSAPHPAKGPSPDKIFAEVMHSASQFDRNVDLPSLRRAYVFASDRHRGELRLSGDPYVLHAVEVARILVELRLDTQTLCGGLLHDVLEDLESEQEEQRLRKEIEVKFGADVALIVDGLTKISKIRLLNLQQRQIDSFRRMLLAIAKDVRVLLVKFADRLHNMRTLAYLPEDKQLRIAGETLDVYAPLAHRFGMGRMRRELEDLAFKYVDPAGYASIERFVQEKQERLGSHVEALCSEVQEGLLSRRIPAEVTGRVKHLYSIHRKPEIERLSIAPYDRHRPAGHGRRGADSHEEDAPGGGRGHRAPLALQRGPAHRRH
jgi:GTP pyrophosphokinase